MSYFPPPTTAPAGWYPDPHGWGQRYFDGRAWAPPVPRFDEPEQHPSLPLRAALGALAVLMVSLVLGKVIVEALVSYDWPLIVYIAISVVLSYGPSVVWGIYVRRRWGAGRLASLGWKFRWSDLGWGPLTWLAAVLSQSVLAAAVLIFEIPLSSNIDGTSDFDADRAYLIATLIAAVIAAPIVEEIVFRGLVMRGFLSRMGPVAAIGLQGVLFGVAHVDPVRGIGQHRTRPGALGGRCRVRGSRLFHPSAGTDRDRPRDLQCRRVHDRAHGGVGRRRSQLRARSSWRYQSSSSTRLSIRRTSPNHAASNTTTTESIRSTGRSVSTSTTSTYSSDARGSASIEATTVRANRCR